MFPHSRWFRSVRWPFWLIAAVALGLGLLLFQLSGSISASSVGVGGDPAYPDPFWRAGTLGDVAVVDMAASPDYDRDNTLFAVTADKLYRTQDRGNHWWALPVGLVWQGERFGRIVLSPGYAVDMTLFATYFTPDTNTTTILQAWNRGDIWLRVGSLADEVRVMRLSPAFNQDHTIFALSGAGMELWRSTDAGQNWSAFPFVAGDVFNATDLVVSPNFAADRTLFVTGLGGVSRSTDGGETWVAQNRMGPTYAAAISPDFATDGTVWESYRLMEGIGDGTPESGIIRTVDRGTNWALTSAGLPDSYEPFPRSLAVSPNFAADQTIFAAYGGQIVSTPERGLFRSGDGGSSWTDLGPAPGNPDINRIVVTHSVPRGVDRACGHGAWGLALWGSGGSAVAEGFSAPTSASLANAHTDTHGHEHAHSHPVTDKNPHDCGDFISHPDGHMDSDPVLDAHGYEDADPYADGDPVKHADGHPFFNTDKHAHRPAAD